MKAIILAGGKGLRLGDLTMNTPKVLMDLGNGKTVLEMNLQNMLDSKVVDEIVLITGYHGSQIDAKIKKYQDENIKIKTLHNPFYEFSANLIGLWIAKEDMRDKDFIITNGDNIFDKEVYEGIAKNSEGIHLTISKHKLGSLKEDDMKVIMRNGFIERVSKNIPVDKADAESAGLVYVSGEKNRRIFIDNLNELAMEKDHLNSFWLEVFNRCSEKGIPIKSFEINGAEQWREIDFHGDLMDLLKFINKSQISFSNNE